MSNYTSVEVAKQEVLGSRREFGPFVNQLDEIVYRLTIYMDQSIYKSTSSYTKA